RPDSAPFDAEELKVIAHFGRYVEKSLRLSIQLIDAEVSKIGLAEALANLGMGIFVLDALGRVIFQNQSAEAIMGDTIQLHQQRLLLTSRAENQAFQDAMASTLRAEPVDLLVDPKPILVQRESPQRPLLIYPMSLKPRSDLNDDFVRRAKAVAIVIEPSAEEPADPALVRDFLGLTLGEARVASLIGSGLAPKEASTRLGIAEETVRTVLKRVFAKTGVGRQAELATLLTRLSMATKMK
ncbi:helix-turn-helix transcriptional regulator, partial [Tardiphaga sp.]|uniref:helix-turn-helix transcriptional regulator n=1 Tax=Tardiphaga sp. TaxID=1926292 RepID=UPI0037DA02D4